MKNILMRVIKEKDFDLIKVLDKINVLYAEDRITLEEKRELENEARINAKPESSYAAPQVQINALADKIKNIESLVFKLEEEIKKLKVNQNVETPSEPEVETPVEPEVVEYPEYVQPLGAHDAYNVGDKITYNGKHYECVINNCVWNPTTYPAAWKEIEVISKPETPVEPEIPAENEENIEE